MPTPDLTYKQTQVTFAELLGGLIGYCRTLEYGKWALRLDWGYRDEEANKRVGGHPTSVHLSHMAQDTTLYYRHAPDQDWSLPSEPEAARIRDLLHDWWEASGGALRIEKDMNHFSMSWGGVR